MIPLIRKEVGEPTVTRTESLASRPFMSLTTQRTTYSPELDQLLLAALPLVPNVPSPKSHE